MCNTLIAFKMDNGYSSLALKTNPIVRFLLTSVFSHNNYSQLMHFMSYFGYSAWVLKDMRTEINYDRITPPPHTPKGIS